jgi:hypothetical protein
MLTITWSNPHPDSGELLTVEVSDGECSGTATLYPSAQQRDDPAVDEWGIRTIDARRGEFLSGVNLPLRQARIMAIGFATNKVVEIPYDAMMSLRG